MTNIIERLAYSLGKKDQTPNLTLAKQIIVEENTLAVSVLIDNLYHKDKGIQSDCIKILFVVGEHAPELITDYTHEFVNLLHQKNNRLQWGGMAALHSITINSAMEVYQALPQIIKVANNGTVITRVHAVGILIKLCTVELYANEAYELLLIQLKNASHSQLPIYAERSLPAIKAHQQNSFIKLLLDRMEHIKQDSKKKRIENVLKRMAVKQTAA